MFARLDNRLYELKLHTRDPYEDRRSYDSKTRVYGAITALAPTEEAKCDRWTYVPVTNELKLDDPERADEIMRNYRRTRRVAVSTARGKLDQLLAEAGFRTRVATFSTKAGCSCGCSPGFILDATVFDAKTGRPADIWVKFVSEIYFSAELGRWVTILEDEK